MNSKKVNLAIAGVGYIGQAHLQAALSNPLINVCAIVDPSASAQAVAASASVPLFGSLDELLANQRPDGIVLATPNHLHLPQSLQCISEGIPILLEKPIAISVGDAEQIVSATEQHAAKVLIGHHRAHSPIMLKAADVVRSGSLGRLVAVTGSATFLKPDHYFNDNPWRKQKGAGPLLLNMIHEVHNLRMLCGEISAVQAFTSNTIRQFEIEDTVAISLCFESGVLGTFILSDTAASARSWEQTSQENPAYPSYSDEDCYIISGTSGSLSVPTMRIKNYGAAEDHSWWKPFQQSVVELKREDPIKLQMEHFLQVILGHEQPLVTARDGMQNLKVIEAIVQAAQTKKTVEISK